VSNIGVADPVALTMNGWRERRFADRSLTPLEEFAPDFHELTRDAWIVGAVPSFDVSFLERILRAHGLEPVWHARLVCVENLVASRARTLPGGLSWAAAACGIDPAGYPLHTAMGDALLHRDVYDTVMGLDPARPLPGLAVSST
jgi:DNA polymerase III epsilon subunit-like protein